MYSQDDVGPGQDLDNEAEEAGRTARDIEARMRKERGRGPAGLDAEDLDAEEIERYYRNRCVILVESHLLSLSYQSEH